MTVHVFGNCPSPSVTIYRLKRTAVEGESEYGIFPTLRGSVGLLSLLIQAKVKHRKRPLTSLTLNMRLNCVQRLYPVLPLCQKARSELQGLKDSPAGVVC